MFNRILSKLIENLALSKSTGTCKMYKNLKKKHEERVLESRIGAHLVVPVLTVLVL